MSAASPAVNAVLSRISASAGMMSPARTRRRSPGTTCSTSMSQNAPSRLTSAFSATERRRISAARTACPSWMVSSPIDSVRISTMINPPISSPVSIEMMPATSRISDRGSSSRRRIARIAPSMRGGTSLLGPKRARRLEASAAVSPVSPQPSRLESSSGDRRQKDLSAGSDEWGTRFPQMEAAGTMTAIGSQGDDGKPLAQSKPLAQRTCRRLDPRQFGRKPGASRNAFGGAGAQPRSASGFLGDIKGLDSVPRLKKAPFLLA